MPIPQAVAGQLLDVRRQLAFRDDVEVTNLILFDAEGEELARLDHFWHVLPPRIRFGDSFESVQFLVVEDEVLLDSYMASVKSLRYEIKQPAAVGGISIASLVLPGADYFVGNTGTIDGGDGLATYEITSIGEADTVSGFKIVEPGSGYVPGPATTQATTGPGFGLSVNIDEVAILVMSPHHRCVAVPTPPLGRNRQWDIKTTTKTTTNEFFRPPGE